MPLQNRLINFIPVAMLIFGLIAVTGLYFSGEFLLSQRDALLAHGVQTSGRITGKDCAVRVLRKTRYGPTVDYEFYSGQLYQDRSTVKTTEECEALQLGSSVQVTYMGSDPETSVPLSKQALDTSAERRFLLLICLAILLIDAIAAYFIFRVLTAKWGAAAEPDNAN